MCSIYGIIYYKNHPKKYIEKEIQIMSLKTVHRGPDENEVEYFANGAIGMNRLSIIGPEDKKAMVQNSEDIYSVFNGEITNYKEISNNLSIDVMCDSEVILPMYKKYGEDFATKLGGMFSIAIYNSKENKLSLWRDALGVKPLYYYSNKDCFIFASEIKAIYSVLKKKPKINYECIDNILRYAFNPGENTAFCGIKKVMPGQKLTVCNGVVEKEKYWSLKKNKEYVFNEKENKKHKEELKDLLIKVVNENAYSDVPGGVFLSGGLDSSLIAAIMYKDKNTKYGVPISIRFSPNGVDDEKYVNMLEKLFNKKVEWVDITPEIARNTLEELVKFLDEPLENATHVGTYLMAKRARELGLKTVITGDGSDELFIGYERQECWIKNENAKDIYPSLSWIIPKSDINKLYNNKLKNALQHRKYIPENTDNINDALLYERGERLPEYHNMRLDRMTMAHSIEAKVPFEDVRIADYTFNLSIEELMQGERKGFLKDIATEYLPKELVYRKKAIFPSLPNEWISGDGINWAKRILLKRNSKIRKIINVKELKKYIDEHATGQKKHGKALWAIITLELWLQNLEK